MVRMSANSKSPKMLNKKVDFIRARLALFKEDLAHVLFFPGDLLFFQALSLTWQRLLKVERPFDIKAELRSHNRMDPTARPATDESDRITERQSPAPERWQSRPVLLS